MSIQFPVRSQRGFGQAWFGHGKASHACSYPSLGLFTGTLWQKQSQLPIHMCANGQHISLQVKELHDGTILTFHGLFHQRLYRTRFADLLFTQEFEKSPCAELNEVAAGRGKTFLCELGAARDMLCLQN